MPGVSVSELKAHLSRYLREVRRGGEVQILDRGVPVARLSGLAPSLGENPELREHLISIGILRPRQRAVEDILEDLPVVVPTDSAGALDDDRQDRL